jgi:hypothetical protein
MTQTLNGLVRFWLVGGQEVSASGVSAPTGIGGVIGQTKGKGKRVREANQPLVIQP